MLPFRTEIRNNPKTQTLKIYLQDINKDKECKLLLKKINGVDFIEIQNSVSRNRVKENLTVFVKEHADINRVKKLVENTLDMHFAYD